MAEVYTYAIQHEGTGRYLAVYPPIWPMGFSEELQDALFIPDDEIITEDADILNDAYKPERFRVVAFRLVPVNFS